MCLPLVHSLIVLDAHTALLNAFVGIADYDSSIRLHIINKLLIILSIAAILSGRRYPIRRDQRVFRKMHDICSVQLSPNGKVWRNYLLPTM